MPRGRVARPLLQRFDEQHVIDLRTGCWVWTSGLDKDGYGYIKDETKRKHRAHRIAYRLFVGEIPAGLQLDHLCRNPACVNPAHLEPVTNRENQLRSTRLRSLCRYGHPLDGWAKAGYRYCKTCHRERARRGRLGRVAGS